MNIGSLNISLLSVISFLAALGVFATIFILARPLFKRDDATKRIKYIKEERKRLKRGLREELEKEDSITLRGEVSGLLRSIVENLRLTEQVNAELIRKRLRQGGLRGDSPLYLFIFMRFVNPIVLAVGSYFYMISFDFSPLQMIAICGAMGVLGFYTPNIYLQNLIQKRQEKLARSFPDVLDLLLICCESGMSIEAAFGQVTEELEGQAAPDMVEELALTTAELNYLQERAQAYVNFAHRTGLDGVRALATALTQAERYGTSLGQALRVLAEENRSLRMAAAEKKAAALPPKLTVPMILFFLPALFVVILGPAVITVIGL
ncbi:MAG: type II secretion system F family protein [Parvibaculales bacterium]